MNIFRIFLKQVGAEDYIRDAEMSPVTLSTFVPDIHDAVRKNGAWYRVTTRKFDLDDDNLNGIASVTLIVVPI